MVLVIWVSASPNKCLTTEVLWDVTWGNKALSPAIWGMFHDIVSGRWCIARSRFWYLQWRNWLSLVELTVISKEVGCEKGTQCLWHIPLNYRTQMTNFWEICLHSGTSVLILHSFLNSWQVPRPARAKRRSCFSCGGCCDSQGFQHVASP